MNEQYGGKTQGVSITAAAVMAVILMTATGFIGYLPVPVLTAIVISALLNVVESHLAVRLFKVSRSEFYIFIAAGIGVLWLGTIYGVVIGILLSFVAMILKATNPPRAFRGLVPGKSAYYDLDKNRFAYPIKNVVIYRFSEDMFFANINFFANIFSCGQSRISQSSGRRSCPLPPRGRSDGSSFQESNERPPGGPGSPAGS